MGLERQGWLGRADPDGLAGLVRIQFIGKSRLQQNEEYPDELKGGWRWQRNNKFIRGTFGGGSPMNEVWRDHVNVWCIPDQRFQNVDIIVEFLAIATT
jgi:hypothetical protein